MVRVNYKLMVSGRVQGVAFRISMREKATHHGVEGWVRNKHDGTVEALVQGEEDDVAKVVEWARRGPPGAKVISLSTERLETYPRQVGFRIVL